MPIDGLVSGLDTATIIKQLMNIERIPQNQLIVRRDATQAGMDALASLRTKVRSIGSAATALQGPTDWIMRSVASSNERVAIVTATGGAPIGALSFTVEQLAAAHSLRSDHTAATGATVMASSGTLSLDRGDGNGPTTINVGNGTLDEVVAGINAAKLGVRATAVNTGSGFRLQVTASETGAGSGFTLTGLDPAFGDMGVAVQGRDARIRLGEGAGSYTVTSSRNRFEGVVAGLSIDVRSVSTDPVTVTVEDNVSGIVGKVKALIEAVNAVMDEVATVTKYDAETRRGGPLTGDATVRRLAADMRRAVTDVVTQSGIGSAGLAGITLGRDGRFTLDEAKFTKAYQDDPDSVQRLFTRGATTTGDVTFISAGWRAANGSYTVNVTAPATEATDLGTLPAEGENMVIRAGGRELTFTVGAGETVQDAAARLNTELQAAGIAVQAVEEGGSLRLTANTAGSAVTFEVAWDGSTFATRAGTDVVGTIDGVTATGRGHQLSIPATDGRLGGLTVRVVPGATGDVGVINYEAGVAGRLATVVNRANDPLDGTFTGAENLRKTRIETFNRSINDFERRLEIRERRLRKQFADLESALGAAKNQGNWLASQIDSLQSLRPPR